VAQLVVLRVLAVAEGEGEGEGEGGQPAGGDTLLRHRGVPLRALTACLHDGAAPAGTAVGAIDHAACVAALVDAGLVVVVAGVLPDPAARVRVACRVMAAALSLRAMSEQRHAVQHALQQGGNDTAALVGGGGGEGEGEARLWRDTVGGDTDESQADSEVAGSRDAAAGSSWVGDAPEQAREPPSAALLACMAARRDRAWVRRVGA
jgi:hypothetical protein